MGKQPPCTAASLAGLETAPAEKPFFSDPFLPFGVTAASGGVSFAPPPIAVITRREEDDVSEGRRLGTPLAPNPGFSSVAGFAETRREGATSGR